MNKYFKLLTMCVLSAIAGLAIAMINPVHIGIIIALVGMIYSGIKFMKAE